MGKGWSLWGLERYAEAAAAFEKAAERMEEPAAQAQARMKAADALFASRQFTSAQERYLQAARTAPDEVLRLQAQYQAGECAARLGDNARAESFLEAVAATGGEMGGRAMLRMAQLDEGDGRWGAALEKYERILAAFPSGPFSVRALHARGLVRYRLGQFQEALRDFRKVVQDFPNNELAEQAFYMRGWCLYLQGRDAEALEVCQQFLARYPRSSWSADVLFWLGVYAFNHGSPAEAERRFSEIVQTFPGAPMADAALFWAGRSASLQKEYLRALDHYNRLAREYPGSARVPETRFMQGDTLSELGQFAGAILMFDEIILQHPDSGLLERAWGRKGDCQFALGNEDPRRYEEAVKSYRVALDSPAASLELRLQAEYKSGRCREKMGQASPALESYMNVVYKYLAEQERGATGSSVWFTRAAFGAASLLEAAGRGEEAMSLYQRVVEADVPAAPEAQQRVEKMRAERAEKP